MNRKMNRKSRGNALMTHQIDKYLDEAARKVIYDSDMQMELARLSVLGDARARAALIESNLLLVVHLVKDYVYTGAAVEDLVAAGNLGLTIAADYFNPDKGCCFGTYASLWIRNEIMEEITRQKRAIRLPKRIKNDLIKIHKSGKESIDDITKSTGLAEKRIKYVQEMDLTRAMELPNDLSDEAREDVRVTLEKALSSIGDGHRSIINMLFGLDCNPLTIREIARRTGLTIIEISRRKAHALSELRCAMERLS